jgi:dipeptidyl aminopeptidase/acylaminoacyl peptidase
MPYVALPPLLRVWLLCAAAFPAPAALAWTVADTLQVATLPDAVPSPDGQQVAYVVSRADLEANPSSYRGQLFVAAADGSQQRQFTFGDTSISRPRWSPDGAWIAYLRTPPEGPANVAVLPADGGGARALTDFAEGVVDFRWSPAGGALAVLRPDPLESATGPVDAVVAGAAPPHHHLWMIPLNELGRPGEPRRLTSGTFHVGNSLLGDAFDWSPDGRSIAFTRTRSADINAWVTADVAMVDVVSGTTRTFQQSNAAEYAPHYAPDGRHIAFNISMFPPSWIRHSRVGLARADGSGLKLLAPTADAQPRIVGWINDRLLLVQEPHRTVTGLWTLPIDGGKPRRFDAAQAVLDAVTLNASGTRLAFSTMTDNAAPEVAVTSLRRFRPEPVSAANVDLPPLPDAETRVITWTSADGLEIEGLLTLPPGHRPGQRHPLLLLIHGGPAGVHQRRYLGLPDATEPLAAFAADGYATLRVNPRGSSGYGHDFRAANRADWGGGDYQDLMAGVDHVVGLELADPSRLGLAGWSYGGFLSAWTVTRNHRFGAAVAGAPITDLMQLAVTTDIGGFIPDYLQNSYWQDPTVYRERSPLLQAEAITTPLLVLHGESDVRVPPSQGAALYQALRQQGLETRMVTYPRAPHLLREPRQIHHAARETLDWFGRHLR